MKTLALRAIFMVVYFLIPPGKRNENMTRNGHRKNMELVQRYLHGLRGIEIGASGKVTGSTTRKGLMPMSM